MCFCSRQPASTPVKDHITDGKVTDVPSFSQEMGDGSLTGQVGTALYAAPELTTSGCKAIYNQVGKIALSLVNSLVYFGAHSFLANLQNVSVDITVHQIVYWCTSPLLFD